ncbi:MAG: OmpA family protein [Pseudomonadota bacterium]
MRRAAALLAALMAAHAGAALAAEEDFVPEFGAPQEAELTYFVERPLHAYALPIGRFTRDAKPVEALEGRVRELVYRVEGDTTTLEAVRGYQMRLEALGYEPRFDCAGDACGGFDFRFGVYLVEPPAMRFDLADFRYFAASNEDAGRHAAVIASRQGGKLFVQVVAVEGDVAEVIGGETDAADAPQPQAKPGRARLFALARRLTEDGHAPLDGVEFASGSARLVGASEATLKEVARLLSARPDLSFLVVGHTDAMGDLDANLELSKERATAVAARLAEMEGVGDGRLVPHGVGFLAPRAPNATEAGRALNRRVELVVQ